MSGGLPTAKNYIFLSMPIDADAVMPSSNTRSYTLRSVLSSPGRSFFILVGKMHISLQKWNISCGEKIEPTNSLEKKSEV